MVVAVVISISRRAIFMDDDVTWTAGDNYRNRVLMFRREFGKMMKNRRGVAT